MFNDCHNHISYTQALFAPNYTFDTFLRDSSNFVDNHIVFLNPIYKALYGHDPEHRISVVDLPDGKNLAFACTNCHEISYIGEDPYRFDNIRLIQDSASHEGILPYIYLSLSNNTMNDELKFFEENFSGKFYGIKVHPNLCSRNMSEITFNSAYPMIIHAGTGEFDKPSDIVKFAENYDGNVLISHFARCDVETLKKIAKLPNVYIDVSPLYLVFDILKGANQSRYYQSELTDSKNISELFKKLISIVGEDKIIFGSDTPWGNQRDIEILYYSLNLPEHTRQKIFKTNFENFNKIKTMKKPTQTGENGPKFE